MLRAIFRFLISRDLWVFLGLVALAFLIWIIGPAIAGLTTWSLMAA